MRHAVILAGGSGTRLWPASRQNLPKQLLPLANRTEPLIAAAASLGHAIADSRVMIVTAEALADATGHMVPSAELITEPIGRNTAAAIGLAGAMIAQRDPDAVIVVLPADHHVDDPKGLANAVKTCLCAVEQSDTIALVGIPPSRPETGYGYLEIAQGGGSPQDVLRFVEKPDRLTAEHYVASGRYLWNAGIFCLSARRLLMELDTHLPETAHTIRQIVQDNGLVVDPRGLYESLPSISFDHAIMEKTDRVVAVPATVGWSDVGSWAALPEIRGIDADGNTIAGRALVLDGSDNVIVSDDDTFIATIGVSGLIVVKNGDAILVMKKDQAQRAKEVVEALGARGLNRYL